MRIICSALAMFVLAVYPAFSGEKKADGDKKADGVPFEVYAKGYFVKNNAMLPGNPAYLLLSDKASFDKIFGVGVVMGQRPKFVDDKLFEKNLIATVIKSGNTLWTFKVDDVRADKGKLVVNYKATGEKNEGATFNSHLILSLPRGELTEIVFMENGKEAGKLTIKK
jgi:hypothetical protein